MGRDVAKKVEEKFVELLFSIESPRWISTSSRFSSILNRRGVSYCGTMSTRRQISKSSLRKGVRATSPSENQINSASEQAEYGQMWGDVNNEKTNEIEELLDQLRLRPVSRALNPLHNLL